MRSAKHMTVEEAIAVLQSRVVQLEESMANRPTGLRTLVLTDSAELRGAGLIVLCKAQNDMDVVLPHSIIGEANYAKARIIIIKNRADSTHAVTVWPQSGQTIEGASSLTLAPGDTVMLVDARDGSWITL